MKKSQSALEFLITYGWAFLVILIVIGALAYFGIMNPGKFLPDRCITTGKFSCTEFSILKYGESQGMYSVIIALKNNGPDSTLLGSSTVSGNYIVDDVQTGNAWYTLVGPSSCENYEEWYSGDCDGVWMTTLGSDIAIPSGSIVYIWYGFSREGADWNYFSWLPTTKVNAYPALEETLKYDIVLNYLPAGKTILQNENVQVYGKLQNTP